MGSGATGFAKPAFVTVAGDDEDDAMAKNESTRTDKREIMRSVHEHVKEVQCNGHVA